MAQDNQSRPASLPPEDALPIKKTNPVAYVVGGVAVLVVLGLVIGMSGGDDEEQKAKAESSEKSADAAQGMTKAELEERQAHILKTQAALAAAGAEEERDAAQKNAEAQKKQEQATAATAPADKPAGAPAKKPVDKKKTMNSLDGLGSDITSALK